MAPLGTAMRFLEATRLDTAYIGRSEASKWRVSEPDTKNNPLSKSESDSASGEGVSTRPEKSRRRHGFRTLQIRRTCLPTQHRDFHRTEYCTAASKKRGISGLERAIK